ATPPAPGRLTGKVTALYVRLSFGGDDDESAAPIDRQLKDCHELALRLGADHVIEVPEPDTSAWRTRRVWITDHYGERRQVSRVVRPVWAEMMREVRAGKIHAVIVYNAVRLVRDQNDLSDVIETAKDHGAYWTAVSGSLDLSTV